MLFWPCGTRRPRARDLARFGSQYLRHGRWNNKQLVGEAWVDKSSHAYEMLQFEGVDVGGYEYPWWVTRKRKWLPLGFSFFFGRALRRRAQEKAKRQDA